MCRLSNPTRNIIHKANMQYDLYYFLRNQMVELFTKVKFKKKLKKKERKMNPRSFKKSLNIKRMLGF